MFFDLDIESTRSSQYKPYFLQLARGDSFRLSSSPASSDASSMNTIVRLWDASDEGLKTRLWNSVLEMRNPVEVEATNNSTGGPPISPKYYYYTSDIELMIFAN